MIVRTRGQWNLLLISVLLLGSLLIAATRVRPQVPISEGQPSLNVAPDPAPLAEHPAPDFTLTELDGTQVTLRDLTGQVVLINVWATWCPPCRAEMPAIQAAYEQYRDRGFTVLAVNLQEDPVTVAAFMREHNLTFPVPLDLDGTVSAIYQARSLPSSFFVDKTGVIRAVYRGPMPRSVIGGTVEQLLSEEP